MRLDSKPTIEVEGVGMFDNIESYRINSNYLTPTDAWEVVVYDHADPRSLRRIFRPLRPVKIYLDGNLQAIGRIDSIEGTGTGETSLRVQGRDYVADLMDGGVDPALRVKKDQALDQLLLEAFKPWGITTVVSNFDASRNAMTGKVPFTGAPRKDFRPLKTEDFKPSDGEGAYEWVNKIVARHGATIQPSTRRNEICLAEPEYRQGPLYTLARPGNILGATAQRDWSDVPTVTSAKGRGAASGSSASPLAITARTFSEGSPSELYKNTEIQFTITGPNSGVAVIEELFDPKSKVAVLYDSPAPCYRPMYYSDKDSKTRDQLEHGLRRMLSERLRKTLTYSCRLRGVVDQESGAVYAVDTMATVRDDVEDVDEDLWIMERTLTQSKGGGPMTELKLIRPGSVVL